MGGSRGGGGAGAPDTREKSQNVGFFSNTGPESLKNHKATKPEFNVGPSAARQRFTGGPMMASLWWCFDPFSPHQLSNSNKNK